MSPENRERFAPPQGGEPERRRDERRTRRQAGAPQKLAQGRSWFPDMASSVSDPVTGGRVRWPCTGTAVAPGPDAAG
jgi:hypothetical protein